MPEEYNMRQMREEAARRAREMQSRARFRTQRPEQPEPRPESQPPAQADNGGSSASGNEKPPESILTSLFQDRDRTIILALLLLLEGDGEHHELLFALMFLLL